MGIMLARAYYQCCQSYDEKDAAFFCTDLSNSVSRSALRRRKTERLYRDRAIIRSRIKN